MTTPNDDWFEKNPLDQMPLATDKRTFDWVDTAPSEYEPPDDERYASRHQSSPDFEKGAEEIVTMHEKMYRLATQNGKHTLGGGSEEQQSTG